MTLKELLKSNGVSDETLDKIFTEMKEHKIFTASEENLDVRYGKLKAENESKLGELQKANELIAELQKGTKGNEELQNKIKDYESKVNELQVQLEQTKVNSALERTLIEANVQDVDYLKFKLKEKHPDGFKLNENGKLEGIDEAIDSLKVQFPNQFSGAENKKILENKLPENNNKQDNVITKEQFYKMSYKERSELFNSNKEVFDSLANKK